MWGSGEAGLATIHLPSDRIVNKHYDLNSRAGWRTTDPAVAVSGGDSNGTVWNASW
jgi:hypothetical protein